MEENKRVLLGMSGGTDTPHAVARLPLVREAVEDGVVVGELVCVALVFPFAEQ